MKWTSSALYFILLQACTAHVLAKDVSSTPRSGGRRIRGASVPSLSFQEPIDSTIESLPHEGDSHLRKLQAKTKACATLLSQGRGGAGGAAKCEPDIPGRNDPKEVATSCQQLSLERHRLNGDGSIRNGTNFEGEVIRPPCDRNYNGRGLWWNFRGTGERVLVNTCHPGTNISTAVFLYDSEEFGCDNIRCLARSNLNQCGNGGMDAFFAERNRQYYLTLFGDNDGNQNQVGPEGSMALSIVRQRNGCNSGVSTLDMSGNVVTRTINEGSASLGPQCGSNLHGKGLWYKFIGSDETVMLSTCHNSTRIPTVLSVYESMPGSEETCGDLRCRAFAPASQECRDENGERKGSIVKVTASRDRTHYVSIIGDNGSGNEFYPVAPIGDVAVSVLRQFNGCDHQGLTPPLRTDGTVVTTSNTAAAGAPMLGPQCNHDFHGYGQWFRFQGTGETVVVSTCHAQTNIATEAFVYETASNEETSCQRSSCRTFSSVATCENGNGKVSILPSTVDGQTYYLSVLGDNGDAMFPPGPEGQIGISLATRSNGCDAARFMQDNGSMNIVNNTESPLLGPQCKEDKHGRGQWYEVVGKGRNVVISTCHPETTIPTSISVYTGGCGIDLGCVDVEERKCAFGSLVQFFAEADQRYKISVVGDSGTSVLSGPEGRIALSVNREVSCPCWSETTLKGFANQAETGSLLEQTCNTVVSGKYEPLISLNDTSTILMNLVDVSASIEISNAMGHGAYLRRNGLDSESVQCLLETPFRSTSMEATLEFDDEAAICVQLLYNRCEELAENGAIDPSFSESCSPEDYIDTLFLAEPGGVYTDCLNITTAAPTSSPTESPTSSPTMDPESCPCWTESELELATPETLNFVSSSCNTEITSGEALSASLPASRSSVRAGDIFGFGAIITRLGDPENRVSCMIAGLSTTRNIYSLDESETRACVTLLHNRCAELSIVGVVPSTFEEQCSIDDFYDTLESANDFAEHVNCLEL